LYANSRDTYRKYIYKVGGPTGRFKMNIYVTTFLFVVLICAISHQAESFTTDVPEVSTTMEPIVSVRRCIRLFGKSKGGKLKKKCRHLDAIVLGTFIRDKPKNGRKYCRRLELVGKTKKTKHGIVPIIIRQCRKSGPY